MKKNQKYQIQKSLVQIKLHLQINLALKMTAAFKFFTISFFIIATVIDVLNFSTIKVSLNLSIGALQIVKFNVKIGIS